MLASADAPAADERVRAADMLYGIGERDTVFYYAEDLAEESTDVAALEALGELAGRRNDARVMLQVGKSALARGLRARPLRLSDHRHPRHKQVAPAIETQRRSIRSRAPRARSTSATSRRQTRSA